MYKLLLPFLLAVFTGNYSFAQSDSISYLFTNTVKINQPFTVGIKYTNQHKYSISLAGLQNFTKVSGPNTSSQTQWINGVVSQSGTVTYTLKCDKPDAYQLSIQVTENDSVIDKFPIVIKVSKQRWTKAEEETAANEAAKNDFFNEAFFKNYNTQNTDAKSGLNKANIAKLISFNPKSTSYSTTADKETIIRYIVKFSKANSNNSNIPLLHSANYPNAQGVNAKIKGTGILSSGAKGSGQCIKYIDIIVVAKYGGTYKLTPYIISYNGKQYRSKAIKLLVWAKITEI